jgi:uncharacterized protein YcbK (DUF882 family)
MKLTNNFYLTEFNCNDGQEVPKHLLPNVQLLAEQLQALRDVLSEPIHINSAYRHEDYNRAVGGSKRSQHLLAKAADISVGEGFTPNIVYDLIEEMIKTGEMMEGGVGLYNTFVHYDIRGYKARWDYSKRF